MYSYLLGFLPLFNWTTSQVANGISFVSAIATVWTLIYAIRQGVKNGKRINDLAAITVQLTEQNKLLIEQNNMQRTSIMNAIHPNLIFRWDSYDGPVKVIYVINLTNTALITSITSFNFHITKEFKPCSLHEKTRIEIYGIPRSDNGQPANNWSITLYYEDKNRNKFSQTFEIADGDELTNLPVVL